VLRATVGVLGLIASPRSKRVLLVKTTYGSRGWHLPGGFVEARESPVHALHREIREELGITIDNVSFVGIYYKLYARNLNLVFRCRIKTGKPRPDCEELSAVRLFPLDALPESLSCRSERLIRDLLSSKGPFIWAYRSPSKMISNSW
jgi:8-oxo-dGTP pyrophosphatase MutT (NUDIX family)